MTPILPWNESLHQTRGDSVRGQERREEAAANIIAGLHAFAENTDPVNASDPTINHDISTGVARCIQRGVSDFGLESYEEFRTNWLHRDDVTIRNPIIMRGGTGTFMLHADDLEHEDLPAIATAYGMGYGVGMAERADQMHLGDQVARQWQEVLGLVAALVHQNPPRPADPIPLPILIHATACGFYFGRTGTQPLGVEAALALMDTEEDWG